MVVSRHAWPPCAWDVLIRLRHLGIDHLPGFGYLDFDLGLLDYLLRLLDSDLNLDLNLDHVRLFDRVLDRIHMLPHALQHVPHLASLDEILRRGLTGL